jgi:thiamine-phosphate pyrophosphorylase
MEGIRVCEDILRFSFRMTDQSSRLKDLRHELMGEAEKFSWPLLLEARDVVGDGQKFYDLPGEISRASLVDALRANFRRGLDALRSLEELAKVAAQSPAPDFQRIRFSLYSLEKDALLSCRRFRAGDLFRRALYAILDSSLLGDGNYAAAARDFIDGGARIIQLRMKDAPGAKIFAVARDCAALCDARDVLFIVNDRPDIARCCGAGGVHLGQDDIPPGEARKVAGEGMIIGLSTHSARQALDASSQGVDYIALGPLFDTATKAGTPLKGIGTAVITQVRPGITLPLVAIGGITPENAGMAVAAGADSCAVISALYRHGELARNCRSMKAALEGEADHGR